MASPSVIAFVFARGGSKGLSRKNLRVLGGHPLVAHSIRAAQASGIVERVMVSTEDAEIAEVAEEYGADVPWLRPPELASDAAPELLAWQHALAHLDTRGVDFDVFLSLPPTAPLRTPTHVVEAVQLFERKPCDLVITGSPARRNPTFNMVVIDSHGFVEVAMPNVESPTRRQGAPPMYDMSTVAYVADPDYLRKAKRLLSGRVRLLEVAPEHAIDIDTELDLEIAEALWQRMPSVGTRRVP